MPAPGALDWMKHSFQFDSIAQARQDHQSCYLLAPEGEGEDDLHEMDRPELHKLFVYDLWCAVQAHMRRRVKKERGTVKKEEEVEVERVDEIFESQQSQQKGPRQGQKRKRRQSSLETVDAKSIQPSGGYSKKARTEPTPPIIDLDSDDEAGEEIDPENPRSPVPPELEVNPETWVMWQRKMEWELRNALKDDKSREFAEAERRCWEMLDTIFSLHRSGHGARRSNFHGSHTLWIQKCSTRLEQVMRLVEDHPVIAIDIVRGRNLQEIAIMTDTFVMKRLMMQYKIFLGELWEKGVEIEA